MQTKKNIFLWILYDFANSIVSVVFFLYFAQWLVIEQGVSDLYFNLAFTITAILLFFTVPLTGSVLDKSLRRLTGLRYTTTLTVLFYTTCALFALADHEITALIFFTAGLYAFLLSFTFYTPLLNDIVPAHKRGFVSGLGIGANYAGQFVGLLIALPFSSGYFNFFAASPRAETLLPAIGIFFLCSLPMLIYFYEPRKSADRHSMRTHIHLAFSETKELLLYPGVGLFLLSFFFFNDAILTAVNNFPIFLEQVWHVSDTTKTYILLGVLTTSAIGGVVSGIIADRSGHKRTLMIIISGWILLLPLIGLITHFTAFVIAGVLMGFWFGATWAVSRSVMAYLAPPGKHNLAFGYFGLAERASSLIGPIVWGITVSSLIDLGSARYRIAVIIITIFIVLGAITFARVKSDRRPDSDLPKNQPVSL